MTEHQFDKLREHLDRVRPIVDEFCSSNGYSHVDPRSIGRYPRIRIEKVGEVTRWLDLWMELDENGNRHETFFEAVPYELAAGAFVDVNDETQFGHRFQKSVMVFSGCPFSEVPNRLLKALQQGDTTIEQWTAETLKGEGEEVNLG